MVCLYSLGFLFAFARLYAVVLFMMDSVFDGLH
jgi:hypothetical protein